MDREIWPGSEALHLYISPFHISRLRVLLSIDLQAVCLCRWRIEGLLEYLCVIDTKEQESRYQYPKPKLKETNQNILKTTHAGVFEPRTPLQSLAQDLEQYIT